VDTRLSRRANYLNYREFDPAEKLDGRVLAIAKRIERIHFEHNLIAAEII
jgi:hypothetical protein